MREELLKCLTEEQIAKVKGCKNQKDLLAIAKAEGIELTDEQLEAINSISQFLIFQIEKCQLNSALFYATICKIILYNRSLNLYEQTSFYPIY